MGKKKSIIQSATETLGQLVKLAFMAVAVTLAFTVVLLLGNATLFILSHVVESLLEMIRLIFEG